MKAALHGKDPIEALEEGPVDRKTSKKALSIINPTLGDNPLQWIQNCDTAKKARDKLQQRHAGKTIANKLGALSSLLNSKYKNNTDVRDHVPHLEFQFSRLAAMRSTFDELLKVAILLSSVSSSQNFP